MAQIITILGAMLGFAVATIGFVAFDLSFLSAFTIWAISGPVAAVVGFVLAGTSAVTPRENHQSAFDAAA